MDKYKVKKLITEHIEDYGSGDSGGGRLRLLL